MAREKVLVLVRATPEKSSKYGLTVCIAGINENLEWRRLYPFSFSFGKKSIDFKKKDLIEVEVTVPDNDKRSESRKVLQSNNLNQPQSDKEVLHKIAPLITSIERLTQQKASLGIIKPKLEGIEVVLNDTKLHDDQTYLSITQGFLERREKVKMPVELSYKFKCENEATCKGHNITLIDWELNELTRNLLRRETQREVIEQKIKAKFYDFMKERDLHFIMGTHFIYKTWIIIGIFYPPK